MFYYYKGPEFSIDRRTSYELTIQTTDKWVSLGWQNSGTATQLWASQMFITPGGQTGYFQLVNGSVTSTKVWVYGVYTAESADDAAASAIQVSATSLGPIEE